MPYTTRRIHLPIGRLVPAEQADRSDDRETLAWFGDSFHPRQDIADQLSAVGALLEWSSTNLLAVNAAGADEAQIVADFLRDQEDRGELKYETGRSA